jgi:hypothetical protein
LGAVVIDRLKTLPAAVKVPSSQMYPCQTVQRSDLALLAEATALNGSFEELLSLCQVADEQT